jgi:hypothetical protein
MKAVVYKALYEVAVERSGGYTKVILHPAA